MNYFVCKFVNLNTMAPLKFLSIIVLFTAPFYSVKAQVGIGTTTPSSSAQLDVTSSTKGVLLSRVALTSLTSASPLTSPTTSMLVYNTATAGSYPNNVTPGYYYWNGTAWVRFEDQTTSPGVMEWNWTLGNPTSLSPAATFVGNASNTTGYVQLTPNSANQNGKIYWQQTIDWSKPLHIAANLYAGSVTNGGDGTWIFFGANSTAIGSSATHSASASGISVFLDEYTNAIYVYKNGTQLNSFAPIDPTDNSVWQSVDLFFGNNLDGTRFLDVKIDGTFIGTSYIGSFSAGGNYFGVGAWTGTATNNHWMRRFLIESAVGHPR